jgi:hypothetical protein
MASLLQRRRDALTLSQPMAIPIAPPVTPPIGARVAIVVERLLALTRTQTARRVLMWTLISFAVCALGGVYLLETSHVASLASQRASLEATTTALSDANARLQAQAASAQAFGQTEQIARANGMREPTANTISFVTLPDVTESPPRATAAPAAKPGLIQRVRDALTGHASANGSVPAPTAASTTTPTAATATPGAKP